MADRGNKEHAWSGATAADGVHKSGSAKVYFQTATPTTQPDAATAFGVADKGRLWMSSATKTIKVLSNTAASSTWVSIGYVTTSTAQTIYGKKTIKSLTGVTAPVIHHPSTSFFATTGSPTHSMIYGRLTTAVPTVGDAIPISGVMWAASSAGDPSAVYLYETIWSRARRVTSGRIYLSGLRRTHGFIASGGVVYGYNHSLLGTAKHELIVSTGAVAVATAVQGFAIGW